jgi:septal ring factor EnvC (AmiA/AmiB activator)
LFWKHQAELQAEVSNLASTGDAIDSQLVTSLGLLDALEKETKHMENDLRNMQSQVRNRSIFCCNLLSLAGICCNVM